MISEESKRRSARKGKGLLPANPNQWANEHHGLDLRENLGLNEADRLPVKDAFASLNGDIEVWPSSEVACAHKFSVVLHGLRRMTWSAFALPCPDGGVVVIFNETHSKQRRRATLMEEFFHLRLGHPPSTLRLYGDGNAKRTFRSRVEEEAYGSGAASLVPYKGLNALIAEGSTVDAIATQFDVSTQLVEFRAKVTKLYRKLRH